MPAPSLTTVTGTVYDAHGQPAASRSLYLKRVLLNGVLQPTGPIMTVSISSLLGGDATVRYVEEFISNASGVISFTVPQLSTIYLEGNVSGYNNGEVALSIPATATSTLEALTPATFPIDVTTFTFPSLVDTPDTYVGQALKVARVNAAETAIEFATISVSVTAEEIQDALVSFFPDVAPFDWTYDDAGDRVTLAILDATASARGLMSTAYAARLDQLEVGDAPTFAGILAGDGTAGAPSYSFTNDPNTGMFSGGADRIDMSLAGTARVRFSDSFGLIMMGSHWLGFGATLATPDVHFQRHAANVLRLGNASTGKGQLLIGSSTDTIAAQLHTLSNAIGVIPLIAEGPAGQTANLFEARVNGSAVLNITASGMINGQIEESAGGTWILSQAYSGLSLANNRGVRWSNNATFFGTADVGLSRGAAGVLKVTDGSTGGGGLMLQEKTAPAAPATNNVILYAEDSGGKTRLMALFPTGAAVQIAIEP